MKIRNNFSAFMAVLISIFLSFLALGQADGGLVAILSPYIVAIFTLGLMVLPVEVFVRVVFKASLIDLVR